VRTGRGSGIEKWSGQRTALPSHLDGSDRSTSYVDVDRHRRTLARRRTRGIRLNSRAKTAHRHGDRDNGTDPVLTDLQSLQPGTRARPE